MSYDDDDYDDDRPRRRRSSGSDDLTAIDWLLCILCPGIGCIVGVVRLISGSPTGGKMVGLSLLFWVLWVGIRFALMAVQR